MRRPFISSLGHHYNIKAVACGTGFTLFVTDDKVMIMIMMMIVMIMMMIVMVLIVGTKALVVGFISTPEAEVVGSAKIQ